MNDLAETAATEDDSETIYKLRHSLAHVMAQAVLEMRPGSKRGFGPPIDSGFYYDFILSEPISEKFLDYAHELEATMRQRLVRAQVDASDDKISKKVREAITRKVPIMLVVGQKERDERTFTVRRYAEKQQQTMALDGFLDTLAQEIQQRSMRRKPGI